MVTEKQIEAAAKAYFRIEGKIILSYGDIENFRRALEASEATEIEWKISTLRTLCECHVYAPQKLQEAISYTVERSLPDGWAVARILDRLQLMPPAEGDK